MRLIDADVIRKKLMEYIGLTNGFERAFSETPTIEIVRCKDCAYVKRLLEPLENTDYLICHKYYHAIDGDDYCSYGVRQTERSE